MPTTNKKHRSPKVQRVSGRKNHQHAHPEPSLTDSLAKGGTLNRPQLVSWEDVIGRR